jgi:hypothetical protein
LPDLIERYVKLVRLIPLRLLIAIVWVRGFVFGWLVGGAERVYLARGSYA